MLCKLAVRNVRRSLRDYSVYFLTLALGVCMFYAFNALEGQPVMVYLATGQKSMVEAILTIMEVFSVFVSVILAFLMLYATTFMMKRRKKELAAYFLLGLPSGRVSLLLWLENLFIGLLALAAGLGLGVLFSHGLSLFTGGMFQINVDFLKLSVSVGAIGRTALYFGVLFLLVMAFQTVSVSRCSLIDLLQAGRRGEEMKLQPLGRSVALFLAGAAFLVTAYAMLLRRGMLTVDSLFYVMLALGTVGTLLFFRSLSGFLLRFCQSKKSFYYKGLNMFVLRQFNARIHTTCLSMTAVCLMLLLAIGVTASSMGLNQTISNAAAAPCDVTINNYSTGEARLDFPRQLREAGFDPETGFSACRAASLYYDESRDEGVIPLSDYNALMAMEGGEPLTPAPGERAASREPLTVNGLYFDALTVLPDEEIQNLPLRLQFFCANYAGDPEQTETLLTAAVNSSAFREDLGITLDSRLINYQQTMGSKVLVIYLGLYLGIIFLLASAAVLALQQLSQAADNVVRYAILSRLGVERPMADRSVLAQVALAFLLPLSLAVVHSVVGMKAANAVIAQVGKVDAWGSTLAAAGLLLAVYGAYFLATFLGSRRITRG